MTVESSRHEGSYTFTVSEVEAIRAFLVDLRAEDRGAQKRIRQTLRTRYRFFISDFSVRRKGFTAANLDRMVRRNVIRIQGPSAPPPE